MESFYEVDWSKSALHSLNKTYEHLEKNWTEKEIISPSKEIEKTISIISQNPTIFQKTNTRNIRRAVVLGLNSIFYYVDRRKKLVTISAFFGNRQNPNKI